MSQPIDIPVKKRRSQRPSLEKCLFPGDEGPYFGYIELFESGQVYRALSSGSGKFVEIGTRCTLPTLSFIIEKDRSKKQVTLDLVSSTLKQAVSRAIVSLSPSSASPDLDFINVLKNYDNLKAHLQHLCLRFPLDDVTLEMRLLVEDVLLERALYDGIGVEVLRQRQVLCATHLQDIHARHISIGLDEIQTCFSLGSVPDEMDQGHLEALNNRFAELARLGDYAELRSLCEPFVRSGEIELQYNATLLLDVLDHGHLDIYQYVLDLIDRTKPSSQGIVDSQYADVTFDPLYVAIHLGRVDAVEAFVEEYATFEGHVFDGAVTDPDRIFTPLLAAVYWQHARIIRLLLRSGPIYYDGLPQACALAAESGSLEVVEALMEHHSQSTPTTALKDVYPPSTFSKSQFTISPQSLQQSAPFGGHFSSALSKSVSGITNGLSGLNNLMASQVVGFPSVLPGEPSITMPLLKSFHPETPAPTILFDPVLRDPAVPSNVLPEPVDPAIPDYPQQPTALSFRHTNDHRARRELGREFLRRLKATCAQLTEVCSQHPESKQYRKVNQLSIELGSAWTCGIDSFRRIAHNKAPSGLAEVLQSLLVADALICQLPRSSEKLELEFKNDLGRWRTLLNDTEQPIFDEIACSIWGIHNVTMLDVPENDPGELFRFQQLIQNLVSLDDFANQSPSRSHSSGTRLQSVQRQIESLKRHQVSYHQLISPEGSFQSIGSALGRLTRDTDSFFDEEVDLSDFIHLDAFRSDLVSPNLPTNHGIFLDPLEWKDIEPMVVLLLASVAFSVVLTGVSAIQDGPQECRSRSIRHKSPGYGRSCAILEDFFSFKSDSIYDSGVDVRTPGDTRESQWLWEMKEASQTKSRIQRLDSRHCIAAGSPALAIPGSMSSPSGSSYIMTDVSSPDTTRSVLRRIKCLLCTKTFSSVSNRNKHMREGCALRDRKGYRCRNGSCTKVLTTKWYRKHHELTRCRFKHEIGLTGETGD